MKGPLARYWFFCHSAGLLLLGALLLSCVYQQSGQLEYPYPLDDSYIHLSLAKTLVETGIWSPTPERFEFSSSSPLYTLALAIIFQGFGPSLWWPMLLNLPAAIGLLYLFWQSLSKLPLPIRSTWLWAITLLTPLPLIMLMGMEHALQLLLVFAWVMAWYQRKPDTQSSLPWILLTVGMTMIRYESLFLVAAAGLGSLHQRQWKELLLLGMAASLPVMGLGIYSMLHGGTFLPLSLLVKGQRPALDMISLLSWGQENITKVYEHPFILSVLSISAWALWLGKGLPPRLREAAGILQVGAWVHVLFAQIGGYRYEAYLILLHGWLLVEILSEMNIKVGIRHCLAGAWLLFPLVLRAGFFTANYPLAVQNIYHQSVQVGLFIEKYYPESHIAIHDIGVATYLSDFPLTDLVGIGDEEVYRLYREKNFTRESLAPILEARGVSLAIVQQGWMGSVIPEDWRCAGSWTIPDPFIIALPEVFFWAKDDTTYEQLMSNLREFQSFLPPEIVQEGPYAGTDLPAVPLL